MGSHLKKTFTNQIKIPAFDVSSAAFQKCTAELKVLKIPILLQNSHAV